MKKNLLIAGILAGVAVLGIGVVVIVPALQNEDAPKTIKPRVGLMANLPKQEKPKKPMASRKEPVRLASVDEKKIPETTPPVEKKNEPKKIEPKKKDETPKAEVKIEPKAEVKVEPKKEEKKRPVKVIEFDPQISLNDPDGEYTVKPLFRGKEIEVLGTIKTLKIASLSDRAVLDASKLVAEEIIFLGQINSGSKVILGKKVQKLVIRDVNDQSVLDASACEAREIFVHGAVNSRSTVKLNAPKGAIEFFGEINDHAQVEIVAPEGKVLFKSRGDAIINGDAQLTILTKELELRGTINGMQTRLNVTLTKDGTLKFTRLNGEVHLHWRKADASDPEPRINRGEIGARAQFLMLPVKK